MCNTQLLIFGGRDVRESMSEGEGREERGKGGRRGREGEEVQRRRRERIIGRRGRGS